MALTPEDVKKIATLARLRFSPEEEAKLTGQLAGIVDYIDQLQTYETATPVTGGPAASETPETPETPETNDRVHACLPREQLLANAPAAMDGFLLVPEVKGNPDA